MDGSSLQDLTNYLRQGGVPLGVAEQVAGIIAAQYESPGATSREASVLLAGAAQSMVRSSGAGMKWQDITLKRGISLDAWPSKWKGFSLDGKGTDVLPPSEIRELAYQVLSKR